jgi:hypothetical protein
MLAHRYSLKIRHKTDKNDVIPISILGLILSQMIWILPLWRNNTRRLATFVPNVNIGLKPLAIIGESLIFQVNDGCER